MSEYLFQMDREYCCVVNLDASNHPINCNVVSIGDTNNTPVPLQNLFKTAILSNAATILVFHNHTGGSLAPSAHDIDITRKMILAGMLMNIPILDHIIVGGNTKSKIYSLKENMPDLWDIA